MRFLPDIASDAYQFLSFVGAISAIGAALFRLAFCHQNGCKGSAVTPIAVKIGDLLTVGHLVTLGEDIFLGPKSCVTCVEQRK